MIFATVGNDHHRFKRFEDAVTILAQTLPNEVIFFQHGYSKPVSVETANIQNRQFISRDVFADHLRNCDLLLTHGGAGTLLQAVELHCQILVFARLSCYEEHLDDHQTDIVREFASLGLCREITCSEELLNAYRSLRLDVSNESLAAVKLTDNGDALLNEIRSIVQSVISR